MYDNFRIETYKKLYLTEIIALFQLPPIFIPFGHENARMIRPGRVEQITPAVVGFVVEKRLYILYVRLNKTRSTS